MPDVLWNLAFEKNILLVDVKKQKPELASKKKNQEEEEVAFFRSKLFTCQMG